MCSEEKKRDENWIKTLNELMKNGNWDIVRQAIHTIEDGFRKRQNDKNTEKNS